MGIPTKFVFALAVLGLASCGSGGDGLTTKAGQPSAPTWSTSSAPVTTSHAHAGGESTIPRSAGSSFSPPSTSYVPTVSFNGGTYYCDSSQDQVGYNPCVSYNGGAIPEVIIPTVWCQQSTQCVEYDPSRYFEVTWNSQRYLCGTTTFAFDEYDCGRYAGGLPSLSSLSGPDLYCDGSKAVPDCSEQWYPARLTNYQQLTYGGENYLCRRAMGLYASYGDIDCGTYRGGDPNRVSFGYGLKCSPTGVGGYSCASDNYPSEWNGLSKVTVGGQTYVCKSAGMGQECWRWPGYGSPKASMYGLPALYCDSRGCDPYRYP